MSSPIGSKRNVKVFVLYLLQNIHKPLDYDTICAITRQTDYVVYLDLTEAFQDMLADGLIEEVGKNEADDPTYQPTQKGIYVVDSFKGDILPSILEESLGAALRYLDFAQKNIQVSCRVQKNYRAGYDLTCCVKEKDTVLLDITLWVDSEQRAEAMAEQFRSRPEKVYRSITALFAGNVNYLLDD